MRLSSKKVIALVESEFEDKSMQKIMMPFLFLADGHQTS